MTASIKAAQLRALAIEEAAKKASSAPVAKAAPAPVTLVKREGGASSGPRISVADIKEARKPIAGVQLKKVVDYLRSVRREVSIEELHRETGVKADDDLKYSLEKNPKVAITPDGKYRFKPKFDIRNKDELLDAMSQFEEGVDMEELFDCYTTIRDDAKTYASLQALSEERKILIITNSDTKHDILFPTNPELRMDVSKDFQDLWRSLTDKFPPENEMEAEMIKAGLKPTRQSAQQKIARQQQDEPKKKKSRGPRKIHNTHIEGYAEQAKNFDPAAAQASAQSKKGGL